jgi:DNA-binding GntR family transcriptional regulator
VRVTLLQNLGERTSLRDTIAEALRGAIISGELRAGQVHSAAALAQRLGVSATPVREAMLTLAQEGMVEPVRNKGFRVIELSDADLDNITAIRRLIEVPTVAEIAAGPRHPDAAALHGAADAILVAAARGDLADYLRADREFHLGLLRLSGNDLLVQITGDLRSRARLYGLEEMAGSGALVASAAEHTELVDLVVKGDPAGARELMDRHIGHVRGSWAGRAER